MKTEREISQRVTFILTFFTSDARSRKHLEDRQQEKSKQAHVFMMCCTFIGSARDTVRSECPINATACKDH